MIEGLELEGLDVVAAFALISELSFMNVFVACDASDGDRFIPNRLSPSGREHSFFHGMAFRAGYGVSCF